MALTINRPDWTAVQLNSVWDNLILNLASQLPYAIRVNSSGISIDSLTISESDSEAVNIFDPFDVLNSLATKGTNNGQGTWNGFYDLDELKYKLEVRETISDRQSSNETEVLFNSYDSPDLIAYVYLEITGSSFVYSSDKYTTNTSDGWTTSNLSSQEDFEGSGYLKWNVGDSAIRGLTENFEDYNNEGYDYFDTGEGYLLTVVERFDIGAWPTGVSPSTGSSVFRTTDISSQVDGIISTFTIPAYDTSKDINIRVYYNGQRLTTGGDVTMLTSSTFSMTFVPASGTELVVDYKPQ
jgi:hypothetical protein